MTPSVRWIVLMISLGDVANAFAQTPAEHAAHHPGAAAPAAAPAAGPAGAPAAPGMAGGGMAEMMGKMMTPPPLPGAAAPTPGATGPSAAAGMAGMPAPAASGGCAGGNCGSAAATTPIYSSLMTLPALTPEKRAEIDALASQQINEGMAELATGSESLDRATEAGDNAAMQQSVGVMREGLDELEAGIAARRVLSEGKAPRNLALDWFKREMNLTSPVPREEPHRLLGVTPFHLFTMVLLIVFALAMVTMYFFKMRRAAALFGRLEGGPGKAPPGSSPPLGGTPAPATPAPPPTGAAPPPEGPPPAPTASATPEGGPAPSPPAPPAGAAPSSKEPAAAPTSPPPHLQRPHHPHRVDPPPKIARRRAKP